MKDKDPLPSSKPDPEVELLPTPEDVLDQGIEETFPASDPVSVAHAFASARKRERRRH